MRDTFYDQLLESLAERLKVQYIPGCVLDVDPLAADLLGAFEEDALSSEEALLSVIDQGGSNER